MAHTSCMLDMQDYMHERTCRRLRNMAHARTYVIHFFSTATMIANAPPYYFIRTCILPVLLIHPKNLKCQLINVQYMFAHVTPLSCEDKASLCSGTLSKKIEIFARLLTQGEALLIFRIFVRGSFTRSEVCSIDC